MTERTRNALQLALEGAFEVDYPTADDFGPEPEVEAFLEEAVPEEERRVEVMPRSMRLVEAG